ncbi:hypothetical protein Q8A73_009288 [Channa argus]|nr:hypothetical protein Q8A73_009288 [Channa argus]
MSGPCISIRLTALMFLWKWLTLSLLQSWVSLGAGAADPAGAGFGGSTGPLGWLLSDKGPFHHSQEFVDFKERYQQGFTTKYKIYRHFTILYGSVKRLVIASRSVTSTRRSPQSESNRLTRLTWD